MVRSSRRVERDRVEGFIAKGREEGARVVVGGGRPAEFEKGWFVEPTVFADVDNKMTIAQEEIFGPVLAVIPYESPDDAVRIANDSDYGLAGSVWTSDVNAGLEIAKRVRTGTYGVNGSSMNFAAPFGGYKQSGIGRELGPEGLEEYLELKAINMPAGWAPPPDDELRQRTCVTAWSYRTFVDASSELGDTLRAAWTSGTPRKRKRFGASCARGWRTSCRRCRRSPRRTTGQDGASTTPAGSARCSTPGTQGSTGRRSSAAAAPPQRSTSSTSRRRSGRARPYVGCNFVAQLHAGPTLIAEGSPEQKAFHLPAMLKGEQVWCQGFSEPNAGSDLASLRTRAERDGDEYVLNGQKIWTSFGHVAEYCEMLVRTNPDPEVRKQAGITWLIVPMDAAGIDIRPLRAMEGTTEFCEVFLDDVRVPVSNRVGEENDGWRVANVTLSFERGTAFVADVMETEELLHDLVELAKHLTSKGADAVGGRRASTRPRLHRRRARRALGVDEAQHLPSAAHRRGGCRWERVQARVHGAPPSSRRHRDAPARARRRSRSTTWATSRAGGTSRRGSGPCA